MSRYAARKRPVLELTVSSPLLGAQDYIARLSVIYLSFVCWCPIIMSFRKQPTFRITKSNKVVKAIAEHYLRDDIACGCSQCEGTRPHR